VWKKLKSWKEKFLSTAGREILIKSVVQAIPTYVMSCFLLSMGLCEHIESMISKFWWGSKQGESKIHWIKWETLCKEKKKGGIGFRTFHEFNLAMLSKQGWRIMHNDDLLISQCLKARYFSRSNFLKASTGYCPSYTWRSIFQARVDVVEKVGIWRVGDGRLINVWEDNWLPYQNGHKIWSHKPPNCDIMFVSDLIHHDIRCWNAPLINEIFLPFEAQQILQLPISFSQLQDEFVWGASRSSTCSVKSSCDFLKARREADGCHSSM